MEAHGNTHPSELVEVSNCQVNTSSVKPTAQDHVTFSADVHNPTNQPISTRLEWLADGNLLGNKEKDVPPGETVNISRQFAGSIVQDRAGGSGDYNITVGVQGAYYDGPPVSSPEATKGYL